MFTKFTVVLANRVFSPLVIVGVASPILVAMVTYNERVDIGGYVYTQSNFITN